jgi:predicted DNA-binding antitoxin AbrB/MazE fold protein
MSQEFEAIYTKGHLVPLEPVNLRESEKVRVFVEPAGPQSSTNGSADLTGMNLHEALVATGLLGVVDGEPSDLSTNPKHMEGFGEDEFNPR